jgi:Cu+-exporting ATPase
VKIEALNRVGAAVGDLVSLSHNPGALMKNAAALLGIPVLGLISGVVSGTILRQHFGVQVTTAVIVAMVGLLVGILFGTALYRRISADTQPVITGIIKRGMKDALFLTAIDAVCRMTVKKTEAPESFTHQDKTYYFCSATCRETFVKEPEKYLEG